MSPVHIVVCDDFALLVRASGAGESHLIEIGDCKGVSEDLLKVVESVGFGGHADQSFDVVEVPE